MTDISHISHKRPFFWLTLAILFFVFLFLIRGVLLPFVLGIFTAYFLNPAVDRLEKIGFSRGLATLIIMGGFFTVIALGSILIAPVIANQLSGLIAAMPDYIAGLEKKLEPGLLRWFDDMQISDMESVKSAASNVSGAMLSWIGGFIAGLFHSGMVVVDVLSLILITPIVGFYMLRDWDVLVQRMDRLLPRAHADIIRGQLAIIDNTLAGFVRGQLNVCLILATYYAVVLSLAGLKFAIVIGIVTGFLVILPYVGFTFGMMGGLTAAFFQFGDINYVGVVLLIFLIGQLLEGYILVPKLVGEKVGLHPVWIIFGMLVGATLFGFVGILLAVPTTAVIGVLIRFATDRYLQSDYYQGDRLIKTINT